MTQACSCGTTSTSRRSFLSNAVTGVAGMAAADLLLRKGLLQAAPATFKGLHHPARAKHVIHI